MMLTNVTKKEQKFNTTHFVGYLNLQIIDPSTLTEGGEVVVVGGEEEISVGSL